MIFELDKKVLRIWRFTAAVLFAAVFLTLVYLPIEKTLKATLCLVDIMLFLGVCFIYLPKLFKNTSLEVGKDTVVCKKGLIINREYVFPNARMQYIEEVRFPVLRMFSLTVLVLRGSGFSLVLPPLTRGQAAAIFERMYGDEQE